MPESQVMIYRGHSSISLKDGTNLSSITIEEFREATTFVQ